VSAIFVSYTTRDDEGLELAERVVEWLREWGYRSLFRDKDLREGIPAGSDWRRILHGTLSQCQAMVSVCTPSYRESEWCTAEVAVALDRGKTVFPLQVGKTELPLLLRNSQAIALEDLIVLAAEAEQEAKERLRLALERRLSWRDKMPLPPSDVGPFPGLKAYDEQHSALFFGRDAELYRVLDEVQSLEGGSDFLLLYGASGCGKSSLLKAGLVPELRRVAGDGLLVVDPFRPDAEPLHNLASQLQVAMERDGLGSTFTASGSVEQLLRDLNNWRRKQQRQGARVLLPIDQFEDVFRPHTPTEEKQVSEGDRFLTFLLDLLNSEGQVLVVATMRTDFQAVLEAHSSYEAGLRWQGFRLEPMPAAFYQDVIEGPCKRFSLVLQPGLKEQMVADTGTGDALPLLAFTLQAMWKKGIRRRDGDGPPQLQKPIDFLWDDYNAIGTVEGSVRQAAERVERACTEVQLAALKDAFLDHLLRWNEEGDGKAAKQKVLRSELPAESLPVVQRMIDRERLLVSDAGSVEIAHEALMRTWPTLVGWIEEGKGALRQRLRVKRLIDELKPEAPERQQRQALEQLAALAGGGGSEERAVQKEGTSALSELLVNSAYPLAAREDAALVLALIGADLPLRQCLADLDAPVKLRRRAAESIGLLSLRCRSPEIRMQLENVLASLMSTEKVCQYVSSDTEWEAHDEVLFTLQGLSRGIQISAAADLPTIGNNRPGRKVPMLSLRALDQPSGLFVRTHIEHVEVWKLPLPNDLFLEVVAIPAGTYIIGSPLQEFGRSEAYKDFRTGCDHIDVEALRVRSIKAFYLSRYPITQLQWRTVVEICPTIKRILDPAPGRGKAEGLWDQYAQKDCIAIDGVEWEDCKEWVERVNFWLQRNWPSKADERCIPCLDLPSESQWEAACRAGSAEAFHFGDTIDSMWARYNCSESYGNGRSRPNLRFKQPGTVGSFGIVNSFGLSDMHGQIQEWCGDQWHRDPVNGAPEDDRPWDGPDPGLGHNRLEQEAHLLRGGSWQLGPVIARSAMRGSNVPTIVDLSNVGLRPCIKYPTDGA
jgi:formylglycine-generating enzyme required for sulfatase activity